MSPNPRRSRAPLGAKEQRATPWEEHLALMFSADPYQGEQSHSYEVTPYGRGSLIYEVARHLCRFGAAQVHERGY